MQRIGVACLRAASPLVVLRRRAFGSLPPAIVSALQKSFKIEAPTEIQSKAVDVILKHQSNVVIGAPTGSGKTIAYLAPLMANMLSAEPRMHTIVLVPTQDLAAQVSHVFNRIAAELPADVPRMHAATLSPVDPSLHMSEHTRLLALTANAAYMQRIPEMFPYALGTVVVDEFDMIMAGGEAHTLWDVLRLFGCLTGRRHKRATPIERGAAPTMVFVGATLPSNGEKSVMRELLKHKIPGAEVVCAESLHKVPDQLEQVFVRTHPDNKLSELERLVRDGVQSIVFCNTGANCIILAQQLEEKGIKVGMLHKNIAPKTRNQHLQDFKTKAISVLVCTDIASRGIDFDIERVIQYDFAQDAISYIHRGGRTARAGKKGQMVSFVTEADEDIANAMERGSLEGSELSPVFSRNRSFRKRIRKEERWVEEDEREGREEKEENAEKKSSDEKSSTQ